MKLDLPVSRISVSGTLFATICGAALLLMPGCTVRPLYYDGEEDTAKRGAAKRSDEDYGNISIASIPNRDGQKLRSYLRDYLRNVRSPKMHLKVDLELKEKSFALDSKGGAHRILATYIAKATLTKDSDHSIVFERTFTASNTYNIARAQGEVMLSLYGRNDFVLLKELARRVGEGIKISVVLQ